MSLLFPIPLAIERGNGQAGGQIGQILFHGRGNMRAVVGNIDDKIADFVPVDRKARKNNGKCKRNGYYDF